MQFKKQVFAERLRELREKAGLNQKDCAAKLLISRGSISFYENGDRLPDIETVYNMAAFFNVSSDYLLGLSEGTEINDDIKVISKYTKLSEESLNKIIEMSHAKAAVATVDINTGKPLFHSILIDDDIKQLNYLIEDEQFYYVLRLLKEYSVADLKLELFKYKNREYGLDKNPHIQSRLSIENSDLTDETYLCLFKLQQEIIEMSRRLSHRNIKEKSQYFTIDFKNNDK